MSSSRCHMTVRKLQFASIFFRLKKRVGGSGLRVQGFNLNPRSAPHSAPDLSWPETDSCQHDKDVWVEQAGWQM